MSEAQNESQMEVADGTSFVTEADGPAGSGTESLAQMTGLSVPSPSDESEMVTTNENVVDDELVEANDYMEEQTEETSVEAKESIGRSDLTPTGEDIVSDKTSESAHDEASPKDLALKDLESNPNSNEGLSEADLTSTNESDVITTDKTVVQKLDEDGDDEKRQPKSLITDPNVEDEKESDVKLNSTDVCSSITVCRVVSGQSFEPKELKEVKKEELVDVKEEVKEESSVKSENLPDCDKEEIKSETSTSNQDFKTEKFSAKKQDPDCLETLPITTQEIKMNSENSVTVETKGSVSALRRSGSKEEVKADVPAKKVKRPQVFIDWVCVNPNCTLNGKSNPEMCTTAKSFVLGHYGVKVDETKKRKICYDCLENAEESQFRMVERLIENQLVIDELLPIPRESTVTLDDSDQEMHTDSSSESEVEVEVEVSTSSSDDDESAMSKSTKAQKARNFLSQLIDGEIKRLNVDNQIDESLKKLTKGMDELMPDVEMIDKTFDEIETMVDEMRENLYRPFRPVLQFLEPLDINDIEIAKPSQPELTNNRGIVAKRVTQHPTGQQQQPQQRTPQRYNQPEVLALAQPVGNLSQTDIPDLPPQGGKVDRPLLTLGERAFAMRGSILNEWKEGVVSEIIEKEGEKLFKLRFETINGKNRNIQTKILSLKHLAYSTTSPVRLQVGTRIIGLYKEYGNETAIGSYYSGIVAEPPKQMNRHRYLVFFDDGYASYIHHKDIRVVCKQSEECVWEDVHANSREFIMKYLMQYPERPMVKLTVGQVVRTEWEGSWWFTQVEEVDASLVKLLFHVNGHRESIYRGSTRLGPLYLEMQEQKKRFESGGRAISRRNTAFNRNKPYVEYTRQTDDDQNAVDGVSSPGGSDQPVKRAVARKSTTTAKKPDASSSGPQIRWATKGKVERVDLSNRLEGIPYAKHQCSLKCLTSPDDPTKYHYDEKKMQCENPLLIPIKLGWQRQLGRYKNYGLRRVFYQAPCGRRLRSLEEIHRYLRVTQSTLEIDFFNLEWYVHVLNEFTPERQLCDIADISYGKENIAVSCVNSIDNTYPEYVEYSTIRLPKKDVFINLDDEFLTCCDCTDDCQDKERCACWQLTVSHTIANPDAKIQPNVGYEFRRLMEPVQTGIFECNRKCKCKQTCLNRVAQHPLRVKLQVFKTEQRGWGIRTLCDIPRGGFICIYVGNLYTNNEANHYGQDFGDEYFAELDLIEVVERNKEGYESDIDDDDDDFEVEALDDALETFDSSSTDEDVGSSAPNEKPDRPFHAKNVSISSEASDRQTRSRNKDKKESSKASGSTAVQNQKVDKPKHTSTRKFFGKEEDVYIMDAKIIGNIGRYLNHSCAPNVFVQNCFVDTHDLRFPWVAFFAQCHIPAGQELCWDYAYIVDQVKGKEIYCECGSETCRGRLL